MIPGQPPFRPPTPNHAARAHQQAADTARRASQQASDSARRASQQAADNARRAHRQAVSQSQRDRQRAQQRAFQGNLGVPRRPGPAPGGYAGRPAYGPVVPRSARRPSLLARLLRFLFLLAFTLVFLAVAGFIVLAVAAELLSK